MLRFASRQRSTPSWLASLICTALLSGVGESCGRAGAPAAKRTVDTIPTGSIARPGNEGGQAAAGGAQAVLEIVQEWLDRDGRGERLYLTGNDWFSRTTDQTAPEEGYDSFTAILGSQLRVVAAAPDSVRVMVTFRVAGRVEQRIVANASVGLRFHVDSAAETADYLAVLRSGQWKIIPPDVDPHVLLTHLLQSSRSSFSEIDLAIRDSVARRAMTQARPSAPDSGGSPMAEPPPRRNTPTN